MAESLPSGYGSHSAAILEHPPPLLVSNFRPASAHPAALQVTGVGGAYEAVGGAYDRNFHPKH
ncbi:hypothetical protein E2C01_054341 [Portunus trituberculatus]|uniref:Uncharacterized protein n=1 Tax=Portunus trituberculatus TaxID=210409 RepID=A0A5B7GJ38_PORTR|nr:hypothetical protein [Portunus trituberculatus]